MFEEFMNFDFPQQQQEFPVQDYRQQSFAQGMNPYESLFGGGNTPALSRYQEYLGNTPTRQDYQPNIWGKILAGLAGASAGYKDPAAGIRTSMGIMDIPYQRALEQYRIEEPGLRQSASIEERQLNDKRAFLKDQQQMQMSQNQRAWETQKFGMEYQLDQKQFQLDQQKFAQQQAQDKIDQAYNSGKLSVDQYQAETSRINANANQSQSNSMSEYYKARTAWGPAGQNDDPNAAYTKMLIEQRISSDPRLADKMTPAGFNSTKLSPEELSAYQQILRELGIYK